MDNNNNSIVTTVSIRMHSEIYVYGTDSMRGLLHSQYLEEPYEFFSFIQMIEKMDEIFDNKQFPQAFLSPRTFSGKNRTAKSSEEDFGSFMNNTGRQAEEYEHETVKCTFKISVRLRQNATWQGNIVWEEKNLSKDFRSVLDMLKLMDEALHNSIGKPSHVSWEEIR